MSHWANYVVIENSQPRDGSNRWGGIEVAHDLFWGLQNALELVKERSTGGGLDPAPDGFFLIDLDSKVLLLEDGRYGGRGPVGEHFLALLGRTWTGWKIEWANWNDVSEYVSECMRAHFPLQTPDPIPYNPVTESDLRKKRSNLREGVVVTVRETPEEDPREHALALSLTRLLQAGPALVQLLRGRGADPEANRRKVLGGASIDCVTREVFVWRNDDYKFDISELASLWPGWTLLQKKEESPCRPLPTGRDPTAIPMTERAAVRLIARDLLNTFYKEQIPAEPREIGSEKPFAKLDLDFLKSLPADLTEAERRRILWRIFIAAGGDREVSWKDVALWVEDAFQQMQVGQELMSLLTLTEEAHRQAALPLRKPSAVAAMRELLSSRKWSWKEVERAFEEISGFVDQLEDYRARLETNPHPEAPPVEAPLPAIPGQEGQTLLSWLRTAARHRDLLSVGCAHERLDANRVEWERLGTLLNSSERRYRSVVTLLTALDALITEAAGG